MRAKPWDVSDALWERLEPLLPRWERRFRYPGRKPFNDRLALLPEVGRPLRRA